MSETQSTTSPVDFERIVECTGGDTALFREIKDLYLAQTTEQLGLLDKAISNGDAGEVERVAHKAAGGSATCGMMIIAPILRDLEQRGRSKNLAGTSELLVQARAEFERIGKALAEYDRTL